MPINVKMLAGINQECKEMILISFYTCVIIFDKLGNLWLLHGSYATQCYSYLPASPVFNLAKCYLVSQLI